MNIVEFSEKAQNSFSVLCNKFPPLENLRNRIQEAMENGMKQKEIKRKQREIRRDQIKRLLEIMGIRTKIVWPKL